MDDVFDDNYDEREFMKREADLVKERFQTMGIQEGILEKKDIHDETIVSKAYVQGFNAGINKAKAIGQLAMIEYAIQHFVPKEHNLNELLEELKAALEKVKSDKLDDVPQNITSLKSKIEGMVSS